MTEIKITIAEVLTNIRLLKKKHRILPKAEKSASALTEFNQRDFLLLPF